MSNQLFLSLMDFPFSAGTKNTKGVYISANNAMAEYNAKSSVQDLIGVTDKELSWKESAALYRAHDKKVETTNKALIFIEPARSGNDHISHLLCIKTPLKHHIENASGIAGITIPLELPCQKIMHWAMKGFELLKLKLDYQKLITIVTHAMKVESLQQQWKHNNKALLHYGTVSFTMREAQCLHYFFHNFSAEKTSKKLFISRKTVEFHLTKIKEKLACSSSDILNKAIDEGFIDIMFMKFE